VERNDEVAEVLFVARRENINLIVYIVEACGSSAETRILVDTLGRA
jgi:hypothetical protein